MPVPGCANRPDIMVLGLHFGQKILKNICSGEERRQELKMQRMEEKLNKIKRKRAASEIEKGNAAQEVQGFEVT